ncbi:MAG: hypothetical protein JO332_12235 [Planctomycetaceae bacterium]|nr:hypothetical protein [Planctomycetaceae bacterium]
MKEKDCPPGRKKGKTPDRLDETNTNIIRVKVQKKDPNPGGSSRPPSQ